MKLAILSRNSKLYSTRRLVEAARAQGHSVRVLDPLRCYMRISSDGFAMRYKGKPISGYAAVVPRIGASVTRYGCAVLRQFELMGSYTPNSAAAIARARDKLRCHQVLAAQGIGLPATVFGDNPDDTGDLLAMLGPTPHVIKLNEGTQGAGVMLTEKLSASRGAIETLRGLYANFLVQEFIAEAGIASFLSPDSAERQEAVVTKRLDQLDRRMTRMERDLGIAVETLAIFVRFWLSSTPALPEPAAQAARAKAGERYEAFVSALGRRLANGPNLRQEISEDVEHARDAE